MADEEKEETTQPNPGEEETLEEPEKEPEQPQEESEETPEETPPKEKETPKEKQPEYTDREKQYYARMKKAEEDAKKAKEALAAKKPFPPGSPNVDEILEVQQSTKGLSTEEVVELKGRALILDISLLEARKNENFILWQKAYKEKVEKEKTPPPSTQQGKEEKKRSFTDELQEHSVVQGDWRKAIEAKEKLLAEKGLYKTQRRRPTSEIIPLSK